MPKASTQPYTMCKKTIRQGGMFLVLGVLLLSLLYVLFLSGCKKNAPLANLGVQSLYYVTRLQPLVITCAHEEGEYTWTLQTVQLDETENKLDSVVASGQKVALIHDSVGTYYYRVDYKADNNQAHEFFQVIVEEEPTVYNAHAIRVLAYRPAPGRWVNKKPVILKSSTPQEVNDACTRQLARGDFVTLGGFGGYIVLAFDHIVLNRAGENDFAVFSNNEDSRAKLGVVQVAMDENGNGLPDDPWYELYGSDEEAHEKEPVTVTYYYSSTAGLSKSTDPAAVASQFALPEYIKGELSTPSDGQFFIPMMGDVDGQYWPEWLLEEKTLTFEGTLLSSTYTVEPKSSGGKIEDYDIQCTSPKKYGYVNYAEGVDSVAFDIDWAHDSLGNKVDLSGIHFLRIYTGTTEVLPKKGELSTEIKGAKDLHLP